MLLLGLAFAPLIVGIFNIPPGDRDTAEWLVRLAALGLAVELPAGTSFAVLQGLHRFDLMNLIGSAAMLTLAVGTVAVLLLGGGVLSSSRHRSLRRARPMPERRSELPRRLVRDTYGWLRRLHEEDLRRGFPAAAHGRGPARLHALRAG